MQGGARNRWRWGGAAVENIRSIMSLLWIIGLFCFHFVTLFGRFHKPVPPSKMRVVRPRPGRGGAHNGAHTSDGSSTPLITSPSISLLCVSLPSIPPDIPHLSTVYSCCLSNNKKRFFLRCSVTVATLGLSPDHCWEHAALRSAAAGSS